MLIPQYLKEPESLGRSLEKASKGFGKEARSGKLESRGKLSYQNIIFHANSEHLSRFYVFMREYKNIFNVFMKALRE